MSKFYDNDRIEISVTENIKENIKFQEKILISTQSNVEIFQKNTNEMISLFKTYVEKSNIWIFQYIKLLFGLNKLFGHFNILQG